MTHSVLLQQAEVRIVKGNKSQLASELENLNSPEYKVSTMPIYKSIC